jgi:nicotinate-nucleotide pyrophosphorylase (carboxylating)
MDPIFKNKIKEFVHLALLEDVGEGDHTSLSSLPVDKDGEAKLLVKEDGVIAGWKLRSRSLTVSILTCKSKYLSPTVQQSKLAI